MGRKASHGTFELSTSAPAKISFNFSLMGKSLKRKHVKWLIINVQEQKKINSFCNEAGCMFQQASVAKGGAFGSLGLGALHGKCTCVRICAAVHFRSRGVLCASFPKGCQASHIPPAMDMQHQ